MTQRRFSVRAAWTGAAVAALLLHAAAPALAHDELIDSDPAHGAVLEERPSQVVLTYSAHILDVGNTVVVAGQDGTDWVSGDLVVAGPGLTVPLAEGMPDGPYEIQWRVVSSDGHPISGVVPFTLAAGEASEPGAEPSLGTGQELEPTAGAEPTVGDDEVSDPVTEPDPQPTDVTDDEVTAEAGDDTSVSTAVLLGIGAAVLIAAVAWALVAARRRARRDGPTSGTGASRS